MSGWKVKASAHSPGPPGKSEMEKMFPKSWPAGWEEISRDVGAGFIYLKMGHISPDPMHTEKPSLKFLVGDIPKYELSKYDFVGDVTIQWMNEKDMEVDPDSQLEKARQLLRSVDISELSGSDREYLAEAENLLRFMSKELPLLKEKIKEVQYLGERARVDTSEGERRVLSIIVGEFSIYRTLVNVASLLEPGRTPIHSVKCDSIRRAHSGRDSCGCPACSPHPACSTLKAEGFIHREEVERLLKLIISRLKNPPEKPAFKIQRGEESIEGPAEGFQIKDGDKIVTENAELMIEDDMDNKVIIKENSEVEICQVEKMDEKKIEEILKQTMGEIIAIMKGHPCSLKIKSPQAVTSVRGTTFGLHVVEEFTTLTVVEGEVEFSDMKGRAVRVKPDHYCICTKEGVQEPVFVPDGVISAAFEEYMKRWKSLERRGD